MHFLELYLDIIIFSILGFMGFIAIWFTIERLVFFSRVNFGDFKTADMLEESLTKNMTALYIIYSNAPYIGLLGTVGGIIITFYGMSQGSDIDAKRIMRDLSLALQATGVGLCVAIPVLMIYNALLRKIEIISNRYKAMKNEN
ncbi:TonB-system energizer ExbB [Helicobacter mustelae]|uniref:Putative exbB/tolQ family transport protein n=1 Tax=Helicobacter mustelae (strain ATCC 43772 / CCUG 25715 / CIP 103759 / LMG 18044 / NCTC 12198 / R85-136P) TaxID=679897 RepID=D3UGD4_HELM1|nr:TonB-system energizer ExbB [Helicobacter mustelae]CBG39555.1 putative exbB/tolQ family transport protein [Helicobacter mustelae 12198]SQH71067.1 ExbB/TolQ family transport protein [Helicobacter mustelae]STP12196.1 ExbB/TolQ family transport protein [Helicobacter mustelae]